MIVGFRIGNGKETPDDLFLSDGPWGLDDIAASTEVKTYKIEKSNITRDVNDFPIERNVKLIAETKEYISVYRALTPRFKSVNLSDYNSLKLRAKGTGELEIRIIKKNIESWDDQFKTSISLEEIDKTYEILFSDFKSSIASKFELNDIVSVVFTMKSLSGSIETKELSLKDLSFGTSKTLSIEENTLSLDNPILSPNPMQSTATIKFTSSKAHIANLFIYNVTGKLVKQLNFDVVTGLNEVVINRELLTTGLYFCKIGSAFHNYDTMKLLIK